MSKCLCIIPARGGSKRIPFKNIKDFLGQPIIKYSIDAAIKANLFEEVMVSTDDKQIAEISKTFGAKVPFFRSEKNSNDFAMLADVVEEVLLEYKKIFKEYEYFCCILPTAPFISSKDLIDSFRLLQNSNADALIPIVRFSFPIQRALKIENNKLRMFWPENMHVRSQDLEQAYHDVGQFYWMRVKSFLEQKKIYADNSISYELQEEQVQDIDTLSDWKVAEIKYKMYKKINRFK